MSWTAALTMAAAWPATAQTVPPTTAAAAAPAPAVDPARLVAARGLIDLLMPPASRERLIAGMIEPMLANVRRGFADNPRFAAAMGGDPRVQALFDQFMAKQQARSAETLRQGLPGMVEAMARAYARRFDLAQLGDVRAFFETPTGRAYMQASFTIMSDPDIAAWQRDLMTRSLANVQDDVVTFTQQVAALDARTP